jgi:transcription elongation factor Elf1
MIKTTLTILAVSFGLTIAISTLFGFAGSTIIGTFWGWFWVSLLVQVIGFAIVNSFLLQRDNALNQQIELEALDKLSKFTIKLTCAYCQQSNITPIQLDTKNTFKCESCNQVNGISMQFMSTTLTSPIDSVKLPIESSTVAEFKVSR